ncbi:DNA-3-methyladenine glycosylase family protein [Salinicoccus sp. Marseille-QA3877]
MMEIKANGPYRFDETLDYMKKQDDCLYKIIDDEIYKAEWFRGNKVLMKLSASAGGGVNVETLVNDGVSSDEIKHYCEEWLDLDYDLNGFYQFAKGDKRLSGLINRHYGYRMVGKVDIADAFLWSILGQQITMSFAYVLKRRVIEYCGHFIEYKGEKFYLMPEAGEIAAIDSEVLRGMQISTRKTEYIKGVLGSVESGELSKTYLETFDDYDEVFRHLTSFRGIGPWSANTVLMRALKFRNAVPIGDAGIKNAIRIVDGMDAAPSKEYINEITDQWGRFGMYGTLYMWGGL